MFMNYKNEKSPQRLNIDEQEQQNKKIQEIVKFECNSRINKGRLEK